jgi:hypothetical protein
MQYTSISGLNTPQVMAITGHVTCNDSRSSPLDNLGLGCVHVTTTGLAQVNIANVHAESMTDVLHIGANVAGSCSDINSTQNNLGVVNDVLIDSGGTAGIFTCTNIADFGTPGSGTYLMVDNSIGTPVTITTGSSHCGTNSCLPQYPVPGSSSGVASLNSLTGALSITAGTGISVTPSGSSIAIANTSSGNPSSCTAQNGNQLCVTAAPYYGYAATSTTTSATFSASTSGSIVSCTGIASGTEVMILGAGSSGANYTGTAASCSGTTLTLNSATSTSVAAGTSVVVAGTSTTATFAPGTTATVASCSLFSTGNNLLIPGAGVSGATYFGAVSTCTGTTLTLAVATSTFVTSGTLVQHDESTAFQSAITALAVPGGVIYANDGWYLINGPFQNIGTANAVLQMPSIAYNGGSEISIRIQGFSAPTGNSTGAVLQTSVSGGNFLGGYDAGGTYPGFTAVAATLRNLRFVGPNNPNITMIEGYFFSGLEIDHVVVDTSTYNYGTPSNTSTIGVDMPSAQNNLTDTVADLQSYGFYTGLRASEHTSITSAYASNSVNCFVFDTGHSASGSPNGIQAAYLWAGQSCTNGIAAGTYATYVNVQLIDLEANTSHGITDPSNLLSGEIHYAVPYTAGALAVCNAAINGAANVNLSLYNLNCSSSSAISIGNINGPLAINANTTSGFPLEVNNSGSASFLNGPQFSAPNLTSGQRYCFNTGKEIAGGTNEGASLCYQWNSSGSTSNAFNIFFYSEANPAFPAYASGVVQETIFTVSTLPTCGGSSAPKGSMASVSDATVPTYLGGLTGGGTTFTPVTCNGSAWVSY